MADEHHRVQTGRTILVAVPEGRVERDNKQSLALVAVGGSDSRGGGSEVVGWWYS